MLLRISCRFGFRHCGLGMFLGIETVSGAGWQSDRAILTSRASKSASEGVGEDEAVESVRMDRAWLPDLRVTMTLRQNCL